MLVVCVCSLRVVVGYCEWFFCVYSVRGGWCGVWLWWGLVVCSVGLQVCVYGSLGVSVFLYVSLTVSVVVEGLMRFLLWCCSCGGWGGWVSVQGWMTNCC